MDFDPVFERVSVSFLAAGGATVYWALRARFVDPPPYTFRLQAGATGNPDADDWADVAAPAVDTYLAVDPARRASGRESTTHYRVILSTALGTYTSAPEPAFGLLDPHNWRLAREMVRRAGLQLALSAPKGWLLKRRPTGATPDTSDPSVAAVDPVTGVVSRGRRSTAGTPVAGGYFAAYPLGMDVTPRAHASRPDPARGTVDDPGVVAYGTCVQAPRVSPQDLYVAAGSDRRYYVDTVEDVAEWVGVPLVSRCRLLRAAAGDLAYSVPVPAAPPPVFP